MEDINNYNYSSISNNLFFYVNKITPFYNENSVYDSKDIQETINILNFVSYMLVYNFTSLYNGNYFLLEKFNEFKAIKANYDIDIYFNLEDNNCNFKIKFQMSRLDGDTFKSNYVFVENNNVVNNLIENLSQNKFINDTNIVIKDTENFFYDKKVSRKDISNNSIITLHSAKNTFTKIEDIKLLNDDIIFENKIIYLYERNWKLISSCNFLTKQFIKKHIKLFNKNIALQNKLMPEKYVCNIVNNIQHIGARHWELLDLVKCRGLNSNIIRNFKNDFFRYNIIWAYLFKNQKYLITERLTNNVCKKEEKYDEKYLNNYFWNTFSQDIYFSYKFFKCHCEKLNIDNVLQNKMISKKIKDVACTF